MAPDAICPYISRHLLSLNKQGHLNMGHSLPVNEEWHICATEITRSYKIYWWLSPPYCLTIIPTTPSSACFSLQIVSMIAGFCHEGVQEGLHWAYMLLGNVLLSFFQLLAESFSLKECGCPEASPGCLLCSAWMPEGGNKLGVYWTSLHIADNTQQLCWFKTIMIS